MNGRMLSRAIQRTRPATIAATIRTATRGESGTNRDSPGPALVLTNGGGGSVAAQRASGFAGASATDRAGSSMSPQTSRRGCPDRSWAGRDHHAGGGRSSSPGAPALAPGPCAVVRRPRSRWPGAGRRMGVGARGIRPAGVRPGGSGPGAGRVRGAAVGRAGRRGGARGHPPDRVRTDLAGPRGARGPAARRAGGWSTCTTSGSGRRRWPVRSSGPTTGSTSPGPGPAEIATAAAALLAADRLPRERQKGTTTVAYDLRPLLASIDVMAPGPAPARTVHPRPGTAGRPRSRGPRRLPAGLRRQDRPAALATTSLRGDGGPDALRGALGLGDRGPLPHSPTIDHSTLGAVHSSFCASPLPRALSCPMSRSPRAVARHEP